MKTKRKGSAMTVLITEMSFEKNGLWHICSWMGRMERPDMPHRWAISLIGRETLIFREPVFSSELSRTDVLLRKTDVLRKVLC